MAFWGSLVNPRRGVSATHIHGITGADVAGSPTFEELVGDIQTRLAGRVIVAHNAAFDLAFLRNEFARAGWDLPDVPTLCTLEGSRAYLPGLERRRLPDCLEAIGIAYPDQHRAEADAAGAMTLFDFYRRRSTTHGPRMDTGPIQVRARELAWPQEQTFPEVPSPAGRSASSSRQEKLVDDDLLRAMRALSAADLVHDDDRTALLDFAELLLETLEDGKITDVEQAALADAARSLSINGAESAALSDRFLRLLAVEAWRDGRVTRLETKHLRHIAEALTSLGLTEANADAALATVEAERQERLTQRSRPIPDDWAFGEPLRVGDRFAITGCDDARDRLERQGMKAGLKLTGSVSGKTAYLVTDGKIQGTKEREAARLGVRKGTPQEFDALLKYVQPALPAPVRAPVNEEFVCAECSQVFSRERTGGRKPVRCPECRSRD